MKQELLPREQVVAIFESLRFLASLDSDHAKELNGQGFNKVDGDFGHWLASRETLTVHQLRAGLELARKYRRQLPQYLRDQLQLSS